MLWYLARIWQETGRREDATGLTQTCFDIQQEVLGPNHPCRVSALSHLSLRAWGREGELPV